MHSWCAGYADERARDLNQRLYKLAILVFVFAAAGGCVFAGLSEKEFRQRYDGLLAELVIEGSGFEVVDFNHDVDAVVFTYQTAVRGESTFWSEVDSRFGDEKPPWTVLDGRGNVRRYERMMLPREDSLFGFYSAEEIRMAYDPATDQVIIAWVQSDTPRQAGSFGESSKVEVSFAEERIWPQVDRFVEEYSVADLGD